MHYRVRLYDPAAAAVTLIEQAAASPAEAAAAATRERAAVVLSVEPVRSGLRAETGFDVAWWCRELRTLIGAGMTVVEALESLHAAEPGGARAAVQGRLVRLLHEGQNLSHAMQDVGVFPDVLVAGVRAGERTSGLAEALDDYLRYHELLAGLRQRVVSAAIYPAVVVVLGAAIAAFLLLFVIPRFSRMYDGMSGSLSGATHLIVNASRTLNEHKGVLLAVAALAALALVFALRSPAVHAALARAMEAVTPLRRQFDHFRLAKLYQSLALMFRGGYAVNDALAVCETLGLGPRLAAGVSAVRARLARGQAVSESFAAEGLADAVAQRLLRSGERTGQFDVVLRTIADRHARAFSTFVERATRLVEPLLLLAVATLVGGIVVMMYMPVFDIAGSVR
jgi:general secretion pathway protein F